MTRCHPRWHLDRVHARPAETIDLPHLSPKGSFGTVACSDVVQINIYGEPRKVEDEQIECSSFANGHGLLAIVVRCRAPRILRQRFERAKRARRRVITRGPCDANCWRLSSIGVQHVRPRVRDPTSLNRRVSAYNPDVGCDICCDNDLRSGH